MRLGALAEILQRLKNKGFNRPQSRYPLLPSIVIKTPVSKWRRAKNWGDYHLAVLLKKQLEQLGHKVLIQIHPEWNRVEGLDYDVAIVLRGLHRYKVKTTQLNILWNISHPDDVSIDEYQDYDQVFIASDYWAREIDKQVSVPVESMLQCTDPERFYSPPAKVRHRYKQELLFVGNSRNIYRKILKDLLPTCYKLAIYGKCWSNFVSEDYIKGKYIKNNHLYKYYGSADILLNDHWDDMREKGFISNRVFDGLACGAFILTDDVHDMGEFERYVQVYKTKKELKDYIDYYLGHPKERKTKAQLGKEHVIQKHTFKQRAETFSQTITHLLKNKDIKK